MPGRIATVLLVLAALALSLISRRRGRSLMSGIPWLRWSAVVTMRWSATAAHRPATAIHLTAIAASRRVDHANGRVKSHRHGDPAGTSVLLPEADERARRRERQRNAIK